MVETARTQEQERTMMLAFASGGRTDTHLIAKPYTFDDLWQRIQKPRVGPKDGSYYIRGGDLTVPERADEHLRTAELVILDGDRRIDPETGESIPGAPPLHEVTRVLAALGINHLAHTSHSYRAIGEDGATFWKYRILVPCRLQNENDLNDAIDFLFAALYREGVYLDDVRENRVWSQPWYLPRVEKPEHLEHYIAHRYDGGSFLDIAPIRRYADERRQREQAERKAQTAPPVSMPQPGTDSPALAFNREHGLSWIRDTLASLGYRFAYFDKRHDAYRYISPTSETKTAGVVVMRGSRGDWIVYSHHGAHDPLSGKVTDAFSLYAHAEHGGSLSQAARSLIRSVQPEREFPTLGNVIAQTSAAPLAEQPKPAAAPALTATPFTLGDPKTIPPRQWLYGKHLIRKFASATISPGGVGKSSLTIVEALAMVTGRDLLNAEPHGQLRVWMWNGEDPRDELARRVTAACKHYNISHADLGDRLYVDSGREQPIVIAKRVSNDIEVAVPVVDAVKENIKRLGIDVMVVDPFVSSHQVAENVNEEIDRVVKTWSRIADECGCAIELVHHARKTGGNEVRVEDARGASSMIAAVRSARALNAMTEDEAKQFSITERWRYFRADNGKANLAPRSDDATWYRLETVDLQNGNDEWQSDLVGVATKYEPPKPFANLTPEAAAVILNAIERGMADGQRYAHGRGITTKSERSAVNLVVEKADVEEGEAKRILDAWIATGILYTDDYDDPKSRKSRSGLFVDRDKTGDGK